MNNAIVFFISEHKTDKDQIEIQTSKGKLYIRAQEFESKNELEDGLDIKPMKGESLMNSHWLPKFKH